MKKLSIIIVTYNSEKDIYDCIDSIITHSDILLSELEIIVVDNNSNDTDTMFAKLHELYGKDVVTIKNTHNGGYGQGNNVGIRQATAPIILIMNPDVRLIEPIFQTAIAAFKNDPNLSIYGMKQMLTSTIESNNSFICTHMTNGYFFTFLTGLCTRFDWYMPRYMHFSGSCFYIRKSMFEEIGLFDESVFMYGEEDDIHFRITKHFGYNMRYNPHLHYIHLTNERKPNINYEIKMLNAIIVQNQKKGYPPSKTLKNKLRNVNVLLAREYIKRSFNKHDEEQYSMLKQYRDYLKKRINGLL